MKPKSDVSNEHVHRYARLNSLEGVTPIIGKGNKNVSMTEPSKNEQIPSELISHGGEPLVPENETFGLNTLLNQGTASAGAGTSTLSAAQDVNVDNEILLE